MSDKQWRALQTMQNNPLQIATGRVKMASVDHLHEESRMLTVRKHNELLTKQYFIARTIMNKTRLHNLQFRHYPLHTFNS